MNYALSLKHDTNLEQCDLTTLIHSKACWFGEPMTSYAKELLPGPVGSSFEL